MAGTDRDPGLETLQARLGHHFHDPALLLTALTHSTERGTNNQRLEFLGDAILGAAISDHLYRSQPDWDEGAMSVARTRLVRQDSLARLALALGVPAILRVSASVARSGAIHERPSVLADAMEALLGAVFLDAGFDAARTVAVALLAADLLQEAELPRKDAKTRLQEWLHARGWDIPVYRQLGSEGPANAPLFHVECVAGRPARAWPGSGGTRKAAEQAAAALCLASLESPDSPPDSPREPTR